MNGYNFTDRVRKILALARESAGPLHHEYVGTEHLLLGIIAEGEGVAAAVLQNLGIDPDELKASVESVVKPGNSGPATGPDLPYTSRAKKVLELAMAEARDLSHSYVGSEHLLLGLLREEKGVAAQVLTDAGATVDVVRKETLRLLGTEMPPSRLDAIMPARERMQTSTPMEPREAMHVPSSPGGVTSIAIDVRFADGSNVHGDFRDPERAYRFLVQLMSRQ